jgi:hypothetical protein
LIKEKKKDMFKYQRGRNGHFTNQQQGRNEHEKYQRAATVQVMMVAEYSRRQDADIC